MYGGDVQVHRVVQKNGHFLFRHIFYKYCSFPKQILLGWECFYMYTFPSRFLVINNMFDPIRPLRLPPDVNSQEYFIWGFLKGRIYQDNHDTVESQKRNIRREIRRISRDMLEIVVNNFNTRVATVIQQRSWIE